VGNLDKGSIRNPIGHMDILEFQHPYFVKDHPELLEYIRRKGATPKKPGTRSPPNEEPNQRKSAAVELPTSSIKAERMCYFSLL